MRQLTLVFGFLLLAALFPDAAVAQDGTPPAQASSTPVSIPGIELLTESQMPNGLVTIMDGERTLDDVVANFTDPGATAAQFRDWGWQRNVVRAFHAPAGSSTDPREIDGVYISVHEFGSPEDAAEALDYIVEAHMSGTDLQEIETGPLADASRTIYGKLPYGNEVTFYVQQGNLLIRLSASSPEGDPRAEATGLIELMLSQRS